MDINLEALKTEILEFLEGSNFAVFRSMAGGLDQMKVVTWDTDRFPDYRQFLGIAAKVGVKLVLFASRELAEEEVSDADDELAELALEEKELRDMERTIKTARRHIGETCALEIAFDHNSHFYVYEARPDWYEEFLDTCEELTTVFPPGVEGNVDEGDEGLGGYYSNN